LINVRRASGASSHSPRTDSATGSAKRCDEAGLPHCSVHGLRKAEATIAAENGATTYQLMAIFRWTSAKQAESYTEKAEQKRFARAAMHNLVPETDAEVVPLSASEKLHRKKRR
jgi:hypothetical protein